MLVDQLNYFIPMNKDRVLFFKQQNRTFLFLFIGFIFVTQLAVVFTLKVEFAFKILFLFSSKLFSVKG